MLKYAKGRSPIKNTEQLVKEKIQVPPIIMIVFLRVDIVEYAVGIATDTALFTLIVSVVYRLQNCSDNTA